MIPIIIIIVLITLVVIGFYIYRERTTYHIDNAAKAIPLAMQIPFFLEDYEVLDSETKVHIEQVEAYNDFNLKLTINQVDKNRSWDFNIINKKDTTDSTKRIRLELTFYSKKEAGFSLSWIPKASLKKEALKGKTSINDLFEGEFADTFLIESDDKESAVAFFDKDIKEQLLKISEHNKGAWEICKNKITYKEPIEIDTFEKRLLVYKVMNLGFELAKKIDA